MLVLEHSNMFKFLPRWVTAKGIGMGGDPFPPADAITRYDDNAYWDGVDDYLASSSEVLGPRRGRGGGGMQVDENMVAQLRALFDQFGAGAGDFGEFVERVRNGGEEVLMELVQAAMQMEQNGPLEEMRDGADMPGEFELRFGDDGNDEDEAPVVPNEVPNRNTAIERAAEEAEDDDEDDTEVSFWVEPVHFLSLLISVRKVSAPVQMLRNLVGRFGFWGSPTAADEDEDDGSDSAEEGHRPGEREARDSDID